MSTMQAVLSLLGLALLLSGCSQTNIAELIKSMSGDAATVCVSATYAGALINVARTNIQSGDVQCNGNGMAIKAVPVQLGLPASVTISQPVTVTPPAK